MGWLFIYAECLSLQFLLSILSYCIVWKHKLHILFVIDASHTE